MKYYKVKTENEEAYVIRESDLKAVLSDLSEMDEGEKMTITVVNMSDEDYDNLPEFEGV